MPLRSRLPVALAAGLLLLAACTPTDPPRPGPGPLPPGVEAADPQAPTGGVNSAAARAAPYVVMVSLDGFAARYVDRLPTPELHALAADGVWASEGMIPVYPTKTFPNHYALATGLYPAHSGVVANTFWDPARGQRYEISDRDAVEDGTWYGGEPLWVTAERQGMVAASYYWVGSEADVAGVRPSHWRRYDASVPNDARVDRVLEWLAWPEAYRPHLVMMYFSTTDDAGHRYGPDSPEVDTAVASVDASIQRLVAGLDALPHGDRITVVVVSDHGMDGFPASGVRYLADAVGLDGLRIPESGPDAQIHVTGRSAAAVRDSVNARLPGVRAYLTADVPERLHYRDNDRIGDVVLIPDSAVVVYPRTDRPATGGFTHGWDNRLSSMRALFVARGPTLAGGTALAPFESIQVYPLITRILGLDPAAGLDGEPGTWDGVEGAR